MLVCSKTASNITKGETYESNEGYVGYTLRCQSSINVVNKGTVICNTFSRITTQVKNPSGNFQ